MKRIFLTGWFIILEIFFVLNFKPISVQAADVNLILNNSFETLSSSLPAGWNKGGYGTNTSTFSVLTTGAQDGTKAAKVSITKYTSGDRKWYFNDVVVKPNTKYTFSDYYKSTVSTVIDIRYTSTSGTLTYVDIATPAIATNWTKTSTTFTTPADVKSLTIFHLIAKKGDLTVDNYSLTEVTSATPTPTPTPTLKPSATPSPTVTPTITPTVMPTITPTPTIKTTPTVTPVPTATPTNTPTPTSTSTPTSTPITTNKFDQGMLSFNFDDGYLSAYQNAIPILNAAGIKSTQYIISETLDGSFSGYVNASQVLTMQAAGHEIGDHTITHPHLTTLTDAQILSEIQDSKNALLASGITKISSLSYPYGEYNSTVIQKAKEAGLIAGRTAYPDGENYKDTDKFKLLTVDVEITTTVSEVESWIDKAMTDNSWVILVFHRIENSSNQYSYTPANLQQIVNYVKTKRIMTVTNSQGVQLMSP